MRGSVEINDFTGARRHRSRLWTWAKVLVLLGAVEVLLFQAGLFWHLQPKFDEPALTANENWSFVYDTAKVLESARPANATVVVIGSSVLQFGLDERQINAALRAKDLPIEVVPFISLGSTATDTATVAWQSRGIKPWLVIYAAAIRDFFKYGIVDSAVRRIFYDSSLELPLWPRKGFEANADAVVRRYWNVYRYRFFARRSLIGAASQIATILALPRPAEAQAESPPPVVPAEAHKYFAFPYIKPKGWATWMKWRESRRFEDYIAFIESNGGQLALNLYKNQNKDTCGLTDNPHVQAFEWMLSTLPTVNVPASVIYFPENPVFRDVGAKAYYDPSLSQAYADLFRRETNLNGQGFEDWRSLLEPEDFYDMIHVNLVGRQKLVDHFVRMIEAEWRRRQSLSGPLAQL